jgi:hypothetical protein
MLSLSVQSRACASLILFFKGTSQRVILPKVFFYLNQILIYIGPFLRVWKYFGKNVLRKIVVSHDSNFVIFNGTGGTSVPVKTGYSDS